MGVKKNWKWFCLCGNRSGHVKTK